MNKVSTIKNDNDVTTTVPFLLLVLQTSKHLNTASGGPNSIKNAQRCLIYTTKILNKGAFFPKVTEALVFFLVKPALLLFL